MTLTLTVETITPERAKEILATLNVGNRKPSADTVKRYARLMRDGAWRQATPEPLAFDTEGYLLQGQHRLGAVALSGVPTTFSIIRGAQRADFSVLDSGLKRTAAQLIGAEHGNGTNLAAATGYVRVLTGQAAPGSSAGTDGKGTTNERMTAFSEWEDALLAHLGDARRAQAAVGMNVGRFLAVLAVASRTIYADRIDAFVYGVCEGAGLAERDPRLVLRNRWIKDGRALAKEPGGLAVIVKAWNAFATGEEIAFLRFGATEALPSVTGFAVSPVA